MATATSGIINLNKPTGISSAKALYRVRKITQIKKSGHTGTLDPAAEGVLVLCLGKATKLVESVMDQPKVYRTVARLDLTSEGFDSEGDTQPVQVSTIPDMDEVAARLAGFEGEIEQVPPALSALKVNGVPAYKLARQNKAPKLAARPVTIYWTHLHSYKWPEIDFEICCGRGTYVRSLIRDLGEALGTGGCLTRLIRRAVGPFHLDQAWTTEQMETSDLDDYIVPLEQARHLVERRPVVIPDKPDQT